MSAGLYLAASDSSLMPADLDKALTAGCGEAPTVVVVSACFAGNSPCRRCPGKSHHPDGVDANRTSFGCGASIRYTYFDECFLGSLDESPN